MGPRRLDANKVDRCLYLYPTGAIFGSGPFGLVGLYGPCLGVHDQMGREEFSFTTLNFYFKTLSH